MENIHKCKCRSKFQDDRYGDGMRVHTVGKKDQSCTVCGAKRSGGSDAAKKPK